MRERAWLGAAFLGTLALWPLWLLTYDTGNADASVLPDLVGAVAALLGLFSLLLLVAVVATLLWRPQTGRLLGLFLGAAVAGSGVLLAVGTGSTSGLAGTFTVHTVVVGVATVGVLLVPERATPHSVVALPLTPPVPEAESTRAQPLTLGTLGVLLLSAAMVVAATVTDSDAGPVGVRHPASARSWLLLLGGFAVLALVPVLQRRREKRSR